MDEPYKVVQSQNVLADFKDLHSLARRLGIVGEFLFAAEEIIFRLQSEPSQLGEPLFDLHYAKLTEYAGVVRPLIVQFAIHEESRTVFIRQFKILGQEAK